MAYKIQGYGWHPDLPDGRDLLYAAPPTALPVNDPPEPHAPTFAGGSVRSALPERARAALAGG